MKITTILWKGPKKYHWICDHHHYWEVGEGGVSDHNQTSFFLQFAKPIILARRSPLNKLCSLLNPNVIYIHTFVTFQILTINYHLSKLFCLSFVAFCAGGLRSYDHDHNLKGFFLKLLLVNCDKGLYCSKNFKM